MSWRRLARLFIPLLLMGALSSACAPPPAPTSTPAAKEKETQRSRQPTRTRQQTPVQPSTELVVEGVVLPAALRFAPDGRLFFIEVNAGRIRVAHERSLQPAPFATLPVLQGSESGLLGLALDPEFASNRFVYAYYSEAEPSSPSVGVRNRVVRFTEQAGEGIDLTPILDHLPVNAVGGVDAHQGGAMAFGPDGKLYVSVGDVGNPDLAQDPSSPAGKILRVNPDGSVPSDNPLPGSPVFALGFRNSWGLAFHPTTGELFATDNGNKAHDEVNLVRPGGNYGWPLVEGPSDDPGLVDPIWDSGDEEGSRLGIVGLTLYTAALFPELQDELLFCAFRTGTMRRLSFEPPGHERVRETGRLAQDCRLDVTVGPDGAIYFSSVNQILRLVR